VGTFTRSLSEHISVHGTAVMGVLNMTPDSFYDGGRFTGERALLRLDTMIAEGAKIVDIGGESTRPGATPVAAEEQIDRIAAPVRHALAKGGVLVSVDTANAKVAEAMLALGVHAINDVSCLADVDLAKVTARHGAALVLMHARGQMANMIGYSEYPNAAYGDVVEDVCLEWSKARARAQQAGLDRTEILFDPGIGFAKNARQSFELLARLREFSRLGTPIIVGASRKSFLRMVQDVAPDQRLGGSIAACLWAAHNGAAVVRVHDVAVTWQALSTSRLAQCLVERRHLPEEAACSADF